jgi:hypothetical protein
MAFGSLPGASSFRICSMVKGQTAGKVSSAMCSMSASSILPLRRSAAWVLAQA